MPIYASNFWAILSHYYYYIWGHQRGLVIAWHGLPLTLSIIDVRFQMALGAGVRIKGQNLNFYLETHATTHNIYVMWLRILPRNLAHISLACG